LLTSFLDVASFGEIQVFASDGRETSLPTGCYAGAGGSFIERRKAPRDYPQVAL